MSHLKNNINIWIALVFLFICFLWALSTSLAFNKARAQLHEEIALRLSLEEGHESLVKNKIASDEKLKQLEEELSKAKSAYFDIKVELDQERIVIKALKEELQRMIKAKQELQK